MSPDTDRIAVPTNGKGPQPVPQPAARGPVFTEPPAAGLTVPFSPTQLAVGFGILAAMIALLARGLRRRGRAGRRGPFGRR